MTEYEKVRKAKQMMDERTGFTVHLVAYVLVNAMLFALNLRAVHADPQEDWWVQWPLIGWGIGLALHALAIYGPAGGMLARRRLRRIHQISRQI